MLAEINIQQTPILLFIELPHTIDGLLKGVTALVFLHVRRNVVIGFYDQVYRRGAHLILTNKNRIKSRPSWRILQ